MKILSVFLILFIIFSLTFTQIAFASVVVGDNKEESEISQGNNGFGNDDQDAPGNSNDRNNAENSSHGRDEYPGNSKHNK